MLIVLKGFQYFNFCLNKFEELISKRLQKLTALGISISLFSPYCAAAAHSHHDRDRNRDTETPIEHLIVIVGENHTFDNLYGAYQPKNGQKVSNLLSKKIINQDGTPGPSHNLSAQQQADDYSVDGYSFTPAKTGPYAALPQPQTTYATGLPAGVPDASYRATCLTVHSSLPIRMRLSHRISAIQMHRFFQMWQQTDKGKNDLFVWVEQTVGIGSQNYFPGGPIPDPSTLKVNTFRAEKSWVSLI